MNALFPPAFVYMLEVQGYQSKVDYSMWKFVTHESVIFTILWHKFDLFVVQNESPNFLHSPNSRWMFSFLLVTIYQKYQLSEPYFNPEIKFIVYRNRDKFWQICVIKYHCQLACLKLKGDTNN